MKVILLKGSPKEIAVAGALGCVSIESSADILTGIRGGNEIYLGFKCERVLRNSFGRGHGSVGDQANFTFSISDVTRLTTLFLCQSPFTSFLQQSMRVVKAGNYKLPESLASKNYAVDVIDRAFNLYFKMVDAGIPEEDARYILPLCATTNIQMNVNARGLCQLWVMAKSKNISCEARKVFNDIAETVIKSGNDDLCINYGPNYEPLSFYPAPDLFGEEGPIDGDNRELDGDISHGFKDGDLRMGEKELNKAIIDRNPSYLSLLKHIHFTFVFGLSLAAFHQAVRQRTWDHTVETLANAVNYATQIDTNNTRLIIPPTIINSKFSQEFYLQYCDMINACHRAVADGIPKSDAFNLIPHSLKIYDLVHINGWNAINLGKRKCNKSQWEIRGIVNEASKIINDQYPELGKYVKPQCVTHGYCPESKPCTLRGRKEVVG